MMQPETEKLSRTIWVGVALIIVILCASFVLSRVNPNRTRTLPIISTIAPFTLTNQSGNVVALDDLRGKVWVADIIFTRCSGPCPQMTRRMQLLQAALPRKSGAKLITLTTDPEYDSPEVLKKYGERFNADFSRWQFLTGTKIQLGALAIDGLKLSAEEIKQEQRKDDSDLFVHSTYFVVVDKQGRMRGVFETGGEGVEWTNVQPAIIATIQQLDREQ